MSNIQPTYRWIKLTDRAPFAPRDGAGALVYQDAMWLLGGWNTGDKRHFPRVCNNEVWRSTDGIDWELVRPNTFVDDTFDPATDWEGRHTAGYAVFDDQMWILGGDINQGHYQPNVWRSRDGRQWSRASHGAALPWGMRALHHTVTFDGRIWVMGGQTMPQFSKERDLVYHQDVWQSADGVHWQQVQAQGPIWSPRGMIGNQAVLQGRMWMLGGGTYDTPTIPTRKFFNDVWSSADGRRWTQHLAQAPWSPRQYHEVAVFDDRLWVLEGWNHGNRNDVWHSEDGVNWQELPNTPWAPRHAASVYTFKDALWMVAGNNMQSDVWKLVRL